MQNNNASRRDNEQGNEQQQREQHERHEDARQQPLLRKASGFVAYDVALELVRALAPLVGQIREHNADIADQVTRAGTSIVLNLAEGMGRRGMDRKRFFRMAHGSGREIRAALDTADAWGWRVAMGDACTLLDRELRLLWGLCK